MHFCRLSIRYTESIGNGVLFVKQIELLKTLDLLKQHNIVSFSARQLKSYMPGESDAAFKETVKRAIKAELLERVCRGAYVNPREFKYHNYKLEAIAVVLRSGGYPYVSLESALSEYGIISQVMLNRLTVMTSGRSQTYKTKYGVIEFTHTTRTDMEVMENTLQKEGRPLRQAIPALAVKDLKRVKRNTQLIDYGILKELLNE